MLQSASYEGRSFAVGAPKSSNSWHATGLSPSPQRYLVLSDV